METKEKRRSYILAAVRAVGQWVARYWDTVFLVFLVISLVAGGIRYGYRQICTEEKQVRQSLLNAAEVYLGCKEEDGSHSIVIDRYNSQEILPRDYSVTYEDNWCAAFATVAAMDAGLMDLIPAECSCEQQINLFKELGCWREDECYLPQTGDYIYYVWDEWRTGDCTAWANHVGIVADTFGPIIKVIEGNKDDAAGYRYIFLNDICIRGYGLPDYESLIQ